MLRNMSDNAEMDKYEARRCRLQQLIQEQADGSQSRFADMIGSSPSYVSRMLYPEGKANKKRIADDMIERIEVKLNLGRGWFDGLSSLESLAEAWPFDTISLEKVASLDKITKAKLEAAILLSAATLKIDVEGENSNKSESEAA